MAKNKSKDAGEDLRETSPLVGADSGSNSPSENNNSTPRLSPNATPLRWHRTELAKQSIMNGSVLMTAGILVGGLLVASLLGAIVLNPIALAIVSGVTIIMGLANLVSGLLLRKQPEIICNPIKLDLSKVESSASMLSSLSKQPGFYNAAACTNNISRQLGVDSLSGLSQNPVGLYGSFKDRDSAQIDMTRVKDAQAVRDSREGALALETVESTETLSLTQGS